MRARHGLVIGKFYPPHAGHHLLVRAAAAVSERLTVVVMAASSELIPLEDRVAWMREVHAQQSHVTVVGIRDDVPIDYQDDAIWRAHVALMLEAAQTVTHEAIDAVFSSEPYGDELGRRLGARHVSIDVARELAPISGSLARANLAASWSFLAPCVRAGLVSRVVLVGAESTGKTTLAEAVTEHLRMRGGAFASTQWVAEYGREMTVDKVAIARAEAALAGRPAPGLGELSWTSADFVHIAREQNLREQAAARVGGPFLICDTDAFATGVWHERYMGQRWPEVEALARGTSRDLYLLTHHDDVPFTQDGIRDGQAIRAWMTERFVERLDAEARPWAFVRGATHEDRLQRALTLLPSLTVR